MYTYEINAGYSSMDTSLRMTVPAILDCFQDAAIFEAENGRITMDYLYKRNMAWLLSSWQIVIDRRPGLNERIQITTYPYAFKGFLGYRNFTMKGMDGEILVSGASIWSLVDTQKQRPAKPDKELIEGYDIHEKLDMAYAPRKIALLGEGTAMDTFCVRRSQIDSNHHMNNAEYVRLAMEFLPERARVREFRVEYKKAARLMETVTAFVYTQDSICQVRLADTEGGSYAVVEFRLKSPADALI